MTDWMATLSHSKYAVMIIFGACTVLTVGGLELLRVWLGRAPREERGGRGETVATLMALVYLAMLALGGADLAMHGKNFLNLAFTLTGGSGVLILATFIWRYRRGLPLGDAEEERRRIAAHDL
jgi:hypothetical protein